MSVITLCIGNSDDKLGQASWAEYLSKFHREVKFIADVVHFYGASFPDSPYQNACIVCEVHHDHMARLIRKIRALAMEFNQDSIALVYGESEMIKPGEGS